MLSKQYLVSPGQAFLPVLQQKQPDIDADGDGAVDGAIVSYGQSNTRSQAGIGTGGLFVVAEPKPDNIESIANITFVAPILFISVYFVYFPYRFNLDSYWLANIQLF